MDNVTLIRVVAGALAVVVAFIIVYRRRRKSAE
jgi:LPXTG-motif cell wall-anchored protein